MPCPTRLHALKPLCALGVGALLLQPGTGAEPEGVDMPQAPREAVTHVMEPALPGAYAVLTVGRGSESTRLFAFHLPDAPTTHPGDGLVAPLGDAVELPVAQRTEECFTVDMPVGPLAVWAIQTTPAFDPKTAWLANRPLPHWAFPEHPQPGDTLRVLGRNLVRADRYPTHDPRSPVGFGGLLPFDGADPASRPTRACLRPVTGGDVVAIPVRKAGAYEAFLELPRTLTPGPYHLFLHNGLGGGAGWSDPLSVRIHESDPWPDRVFPIESYMARHPTFDDAAAAALAEIATNGGGILQLGPYTYPLRRTLDLPPRTVLRGAGSGRTLLALPFDVQKPAEPPFVAVTGDRDFAVEDLRIEAVHAPLLIAAPRFRPENQDEAATGFRAIGLSARRARNVAVRRCILEQYPFRQSDRRKDHDPRGWVKSFAESGWAALGRDGYCGLAFKGDGLIVEDCRIVGAGTAVALDRSTHARLSRNVIQAGFFGMGIICSSRLTWEKGVGARIEGNETRRVIVEENDISGRSDFARNLLAFNYGGHDLHVARNHLHDLNPSTDCEALLTHLWQARWKEPTLRMTGPTAGRIIDPTGEVVHEWLEGAWLDIVEGTGMGQLRQILKRTGDTIEIDKPWRTDPDASSRVVFTAPAPFRHLNILDNRVSTKNINIVIWGNSHDVIVDGNRVSDARGISAWSVRLAADQKVWGGAFFTSFLNNTLDNCRYSTPTRTPDINHAVGLFNVLSRHETSVDTGYDFLGLVMRNNYAVNNTGIRFQKTFHRRGTPLVRVAREAGVVVEGNFVADGIAGIILEKGARVLERSNRFENVEHPLTWIDPPTP